MGSIYDNNNNHYYMIILLIIIIITSQSTIPPRNASCPLSTLPFIEYSDGKPLLSKPLAYHHNNAVIFFTFFLSPALFLARHDKPALSKQNDNKPHQNGQVIANDPFHLGHSSGDITIINQCCNHL